MQRKSHKSLLGARNTKTFHITEFPLSFVFLYFSSTVLLFCCRQRMYQVLTVLHVSQLNVNYDVNFMLVFCIVNLHIRISYGFHFCTLENKKQNKKEQFATCTSPKMHLVCRPKLCTSLFSISLGTAVIPRRNEKQRLCKHFSSCSLQIYQPIP